MHAKRASRPVKPTTSVRRKQVNIRLEAALYRTLQAIAGQERRSVPQTVLHLLEAGLQQRIRGPLSEDDTPSREIAALASAGGAFDWLADEPEVYDDTCGEPL